mgnify:FL=1|jgi:hypothetical protein
MEDRNFYLFAGVNGAGRSTLFSIIAEDIKGTFRINTDEIVKKIGNWKNESDQIKSAKIAIKLRNEYIEKGLSFNEETTLTGKTILKLIDKLKSKNYKLHLFYVGINSVDIAKERIRNRVLKGGHDIPDKIVEKRYNEFLENLSKVLNKFDNVTVYDNTKEYKMILKIINKKIIKQSDELPNWAKNIF